MQNDEGEIDQPVSVLTVEFEGVDFVFGYGADFNLLDSSFGSPENRMMVREKNLSEIIFFFSRCRRPQLRYQSGEVSCLDQDPAELGTQKD